MEVSDARRLKRLEDEDRRLKKVVADLTLDKEALNRVVTLTYGLATDCRHVPVAQ